MPLRARRRLRLFSPAYHGPWHGPYGHYGPPPWWGGRPTIWDEKEAVAEYIELLKEELEAAKDYLKELEEGGE